MESRQTRTSAASRPTATSCISTTAVSTTTRYFVSFSSLPPTPTSRLFSRYTLYKLFRSSTFLFLFSFPFFHSRPCLPACPRPSARRTLIFLYTFFSPCPRRSTNTTDTIDRAVVVVVADNIVGNGDADDTTAAGTTQPPVESKVIVEICTAC